MFGQFFRLESAGGFVLFGASLLAIAVANSPWGPAFAHLLHEMHAMPVGRFSIELAVNDGLMVIFFLMVGLEIKREVLAGELSQPANIALPSIAALGGMAVPALIYAACNHADAAALRGWAIPAATDIAFSLGVLTLLGSRVPLSLKVFLTTLAIIDDLGAIGVIALFYTEQLSVEMLLGTAAAALVLYLLNRNAVMSLWPYLLVGLVLWLTVLKSGVHATLAGVMLAFAIPLRPSTRHPERGRPGAPPLLRLEHGLHPWVAFGVLPIFAFANAGVSFAGMSFSSLLAPIPLGIAAGLFIGKALGIFGACWLLLRLTRAPLPEGAGWASLFGIALLGGIGFTMSLFIGNLAFPPGAPEYGTQLRLGVIAGSILSGICGYLVLRAVLPVPARTEKV
ncbi:MAG TPA: Na+/H+ antiporter NhaA [Burkholderiales bacterium]